MQRIRPIMGVAALLGLTTASALGGQFMSSYWNKGAPDGVHWGPQYSPTVPTVQGAWGEPIEVAAPYNVKPPSGADAARAMLAQSMPLDLVQQSGYFKDSSYPIQQVGATAGMYPPPPGGMPPGNLISPPGVAAAPPGGLPPGLAPPGAVAAVGALTGGPAAPFPVQRTEVRFVGPPGMKISWYGPNADGKPGFGPQYLEAPARYNFLQASIYRLKLSDIPNRPGVELYPTLEVVPSKPKTCTFLAHSAVPIVFTEEDFDQVAAGNFVVKVIYLPDPQFQDLAATGPDEVVSSRLEPGVDPIVEAKRRGSILLVVRLGNIDLEAPNTPSMDAPNPFAAHPPVAPPGAMPPGMPVPPGMPAMPGMPGMPAMPGMPGMPVAGQPPMPNMPNQMAPNMSANPPMVPYGMLTGQSSAPGGMPGAMPGSLLSQPNGSLLQPNGGMLPPGQMLPPVPGVPGSYPAGTQLPSQPGTPVGELPMPSVVQPAQYKANASSTGRRPTLAELASQPSTWSPPPIGGQATSPSR